MSYSDYFFTAQLFYDFHKEEVGQTMKETLKIINQSGLSEINKENATMFSLAYLGALKADMKNAPYNYAVSYEYMKEFIPNEPKIKQILASVHKIIDPNNQNCPEAENLVKNNPLSAETSKLLEDLNLSARQVHLATVAIKLYHYKLIIAPTMFYLSTQDVYNQLNENIEDDAKVKELINSVGGNKAIELIKNIPKRIERGGIYRKSV